MYSYICLLLVLLNNEFNQKSNLKTRAFIVESIPEFIANRPTFTNQRKCYQRPKLLRKFN